MDRIRDGSFYLMINHLIEAKLVQEAWTCQRIA
jgi:hypothetical protein